MVSTQGLSQPIGDFSHESQLQIFSQLCSEWLVVWEEDV